MPGLLLSDEVAFYFFGPDGTAAKKNGTDVEKIEAWIESVKDRTDIHVTNTTVAFLLSFAFDRGVDQVDQDKYEEYFGSRIRTDLGKNLIQIDDEILRIWARYRLTKATNDKYLPMEKALDVAACKRDGLIYVCFRTPTIDKLLPDQTIDPRFELDE